MSEAKVITRGMGLMGTKSTPAQARVRGERRKAKTVRTDNNTVQGHILARDLQPTARSRTQIYTASCGLQKRVFLVELDELERGTRTVALLPAEKS